MRVLTVLAGLARLCVPLVQAEAVARGFVAASPEATPMNPDREASFLRSPRM